MQKKRLLLAGAMAAVVLVTGTIAVTANAAEIPSPAAAAAQGTGPNDSPTKPCPSHNDGTTPGSPINLSSPDLGFTVRSGFSPQIFDQATMTSLVADVACVGISNWVEHEVSLDPVALNDPDYIRSNEIDALGQITRTANGFDITHKNAEINPLGNWKYTLVANVAAVLLSLTIGTACVAGTAGTASPVCLALVSGVVELAKDIILMAFDGKLRDLNEWANTLISVMTAAGLGALGGGPAVDWFKTKMTGFFATLAQALRNFANQLSAFWGTAKAVLNAAADTTAAIAVPLQTAMNGVFH